MAMPIFDHAHPRNIKMEFAPACKKSLHSINSFLRYSQFQSPMTRLVKPIFDHAHSKKFDYLLVYMNLYHHAKNQAISLICSGDIVDIGPFLVNFPKFWGKTSFSRQLGFQHHAKIQEKIMIQFQENILTNRRTEGWTDPISQDPSGYRRGFNKLLS